MPDAIEARPRRAAPTDADVSTNTGPDSIEAPRLVELRHFGDARGLLVAVQRGDAALDFEIARVYWVTGVPEGARRGAHAHHETRQLMVVLSGSVEVIFDDGRTRSRFTLDSPHQALTIPPMQWHELENFAPNTVALMLASHPYDERDYIRDHAEFLALARVAHGDSQ